MAPKYRDTSDRHNRMPSCGSYPGVIAELQAAGVMSLRRIAAALYDKAFRRRAARRGRLCRLRECWGDCPRNARQRPVQPGGPS
jgi:hypothetical protein